MADYISKYTGTEIDDRLTKVNELESSTIKSVTVNNEKKFPDDSGNVNLGEVGGLTTAQATLLGTAAELETTAKTLPGAVNELKKENVELWNEVKLFKAFPAGQIYIPISNGDYISVGSFNGAWSSLNVYRKNELIKTIGGVYLYESANLIAEFSDALFLTTNNGNELRTYSINDYSLISRKSLARGLLLKCPYGVLYWNQSATTIDCYDVNLNIVASVDFASCSYIFDNGEEFFAVNTDGDLYKLSIAQSSITKELLFNTVSAGLTGSVINMIKGIYRWGATYYIVATAKNIQLFNDSWEKVGADKITTTGEVFGMLKDGDRFVVYSNNGKIYRMYLSYGGGIESMSDCQILTTENLKIIYNNSNLCMCSKILKSLVY